MIKSLVAIAFVFLLMMSCKPRLVVQSLETRQPGEVNCDTLLIANNRLTIHAGFWLNAMPSASDEHDSLRPAPVYLNLQLMDLNGNDVHTNFRLDSMVHVVDGKTKKWELLKNKYIQDGSIWEANTLQTGSSISAYDFVRVFGTYIPDHTILEFRLRIPTMFVAY